MQKYENIVIGSSLEATLFAFNNRYPIFFTIPDRPFKFDYFKPEIDLSCLKIPLEEKSLTTPQGEKHIGIPKELLWERLLFLQSLAGNVPLSNLCHTMRYDGDRIVCSNEYSKIFEFSLSLISDSVP